MRLWYVPATFGRPLELSTVADGWASWHTSMGLSRTFGHDESALYPAVHQSEFYLLHDMFEKADSGFLGRACECHSCRFLAVVYHFGRLHS